MNPDFCISYPSVHIKETGDHRGGLGNRENESVLTLRIFQKLRRIAERVGSGAILELDGWGILRNVGADLKDKIKKKTRKNRDRLSRNEAELDDRQCRIFLTDLDLGGDFRLDLIGNQSPSNVFKSDLLVRKGDLHFDPSHLGIGRPTQKAGNRHGEAREHAIFPQIYTNGICGLRSHSGMGRHHQKQKANEPKRI